MSCIDVQDSLVEYILGELDAECRARVELHLASGCSECQTELQALTESADVLWQAVPNKQLSEELQRAIVSRVCTSIPIGENAPTKCLTHAATLSGRSVADLAHPAADRSQLVRHPMMQAILAFAAGLMFMMFIKSGSKIEGEKIADRPQRALNGSSVSLASPRIPASLEMSEKKYASTQLVSLRRKPDSSELRGYVLCDPLTREIHLYCFGLQQPPKGTQYVLWLVGAGIEYRAVERLEVDSEGACKAAVRWPDGNFRFAKVTLEVSSRLNGKPSNDVQLTSNAFDPLTH